MAVTLPSGFRFAPTDLALVRDYLLKKLTNQPLPSDDSVIEYDIYNTVPWNLPVKNICNGARFYSRKIRKRGYYFVRRECYGNKVKRMVKCGDGTSSNRLVGYWKKTKLIPQAKLILDERKKIVGTMKAYVFHYYTKNNKNDNECSRSIQTMWIMHEYTINSQRFQPWVLCSVINKSRVNIDYDYDHDHDRNNNYIKRRINILPIDPDEAERDREFCANAFLT